VGCKHFGLFGPVPAVWWLINFLVAGAEDGVVLVWVSGEEEFELEELLYDVVVVVARVS